MNAFIHWQLILIAIYFQHSSALFGNTLKQLREKATSIYKTKKKGVNLNFMGNALSDYPGTNPKYIKINEDLWEDYYSCLRNQEENLGSYLSMIPQAILGFEGSSIKLECRICISPLEKDNKELIQWEWAPIGGKHLEPVDYNENIVISPNDKTLHLYNLETSHSGQYLCVLGESSTTPYFLTIVALNESQFVQVHSRTTPKGPYPKDFENIDQYALILDTEWSEWSACSSCDKIGKKHKIGYCTIYSKENRDLSVSSKVIDNLVIVDDTNYTTIELIEFTSPPASDYPAEEAESTKISESDLELFTIFQFGIPCQSHVLPPSIGELPQVRSRRNEIMSGYCREKCERNKIFVVKDRHGKIIEKVNNSEGLYSLKQPLPPLEPPVARTLMYGVKGKSIVLSCPGSMNTDAPVHWQLGDKNLIPEVIARESNRRIVISITDKIHIKEAKISDSNIYSCWQKEELAGTIRLVIEKKLEFNLNHTVMLIGILIILGVFLKIFIKAILGRKYAKV